MEYRGLSEACYQMLESGSIPGLHALLERVCNDPACCVEVRHNYLSCYYRGGSLFKMKFKPKSKQLEFKFAPKYFSLKQAPCTAFEDLKAWNDSNCNNPEEWLERLEELKKVMKAWMLDPKHSKAERETQQKIVKLNTFAQGNYQSIDIELAIPKNQKSGRMDIIAVRREGERYVPVIVELKHGTGSLDGESGIAAHYYKTTEFLDHEILDHESGEQYLIKTIHKIWTTKNKLGLLKEPVPNPDKFGKVELLFAVTDLPNEKDDTLNRRLKELTKKQPLSRTVLVATSPTWELYFDKGEPLEQKVGSQFHK